MPYRFVKINPKIHRKNKRKARKINAVCFKCNLFHEGITTKVNIPVSGDNKVQNTFYYVKHFMGF